MSSASSGTGCCNTEYTSSTPAYHRRSGNLRGDRPGSQGSCLKQSRDALHKRRRCLTARQPCPLHFAKYRVPPLPRPPSRRSRSDRGVPGVPAAQFAFVEPGLDPGDAQSCADVLCRDRVFRGVAQKYSFARFGQKTHATCWLRGGRARIITVGRRLFVIVSVQGL